MNDEEKTKEQLVAELMLLRRRIREMEREPTAELAGTNEQLTHQIEERRRAEEALRKSKAQYDTLAANIPVGVYLLRTTPAGGFSFEYVSPRMADMLGLAAESILSDPQVAFQPIHPEELEAFVRQNRENIEARKAFVWEGRAVVTGAIKWLRIESRPEMLENGDVQWHGVVADITERKQAELALRESQRQFADIINFLPDGILAIDKKGTVIAWNRAIEDMTGVSSAEMIGRDKYEYALPFYAKRIPVIADLVIDPQSDVQNRYCSLRREGDILQGEVIAPLLKGNERIFSSRAAPIYNNEGEIVGAIESIRDITEQKSMERELSYEHQKLSSILDGSPISSFVIDTDRRVTAWNITNEFFTGISKEAVLGKPLDLSPLFKGQPPPSLAVLVLEMSDEEIMRGYAHKGVWRSKIHPEAIESTGFIWIKGKEHIMAIQATRLRDAAGKVIGAIQCAEDITEQRRAEKALREKEELYRTALESSYDGVAMIQDGRHVYLNQKLLDTLGRSRDEMMGQPLGRTMHPDDRATILRFYADYLKGLPIPDHFEVRVFRPDGSIVHADVSAVEVTYQGIKTLLAYFRNITDRKRMEEALRQSEQKYRDVFNATSDALFIHDAKGHILDVNERMCAMFECDRSRALKLSLNDISLGVSPYSEKEGLEKVRQAIEEGPRVFEWQARRISGELFWSEVALRAYGTAGEMLVVASVRDINERKRAEEERRRLEQQLQQAQKADSLGRMAGAIAHHFNNLLGVVMGRLELMLAGPHQAPGINKHLDEAMKASLKAAEISRLMLTYLGQGVEKKEPCDVVEALREALRLLGPAFPQKLRVKTEVPPAPIMIRGDKAQIEQAFTNLLLNAGEAIPGGDGEITLVVDVMTADKVREFRLFPSDWEPVEDRYVFIAISDTGTGFDPAAMERILDPFYSTKFTGRGLGVPVVLGVVRAHDGALAIETEPGVGSTFRVFLPLPADQTLPSGQEPTGDLEPFKDAGLVLVVEDDPVLRHMVEDMLKDFGYEVIVAGDGLEALEKFRERQDEVSLVLLDHNIPGMSGRETLAALRTLRPDLPAILSSGLDEAQVMREDLPGQHQVFLHKPYHMKDLEAALCATRKAPSVKPKGRVLGGLI